MLYEIVRSVVCFSNYYSVISSLFIINDDSE